MKRALPHILASLGVAFVLASCSRGSSNTDAGARRGPEFEAAALDALSSDETHDLFSRLDFWAQEAQGASALWGRAFALCSQRAEKPRPNCAPVLMHATALQSAFLHGFMKELQAQAPGMPAPPPPPPMPGADVGAAPPSTAPSNGGPQ